ncbi:hypothetical protein PGUG_00996 [Meyerozyma guilliermondii ATCC 6260]|uniref:RRM domain-containing protein n=1 Tax=Meyerozyma guilliermondii (strain ATCC 6260 / CBS 566 / DSM 6381 / JCM 1539 / NBRC 10279 / NRRL Y-324) TaxID=294746 RepID=A5DCJ1_PICGU|nr:uncharacterized protein PGUG_00996 [Meyerozyma guilliermondii ATCC 6260]EDK36898.2 hypothetical protein PGUG_00996 [Meyerozyma guilliermondii ATCC 6260]
MNRTATNLPPSSAYNVAQSSGGVPADEPRAPNRDLLDHLNACIFDAPLLKSVSPISDVGDAFPLRVSVTDCNYDTLKPTVGSVLQHVDISDFDSGIELRCNNKFNADKLVVKLIENNLKFTLDYSDFISHPGNLFVKNLSSSLINHDSLFEFFQVRSCYKSLSNVNIFNNSDESLFAILKFDNYLDVDFLIEHLDTSNNPFHHLPSVPLYVNKYISKRERKLKAEDFQPAASQSPAHSESVNLYNTIVVENLGEFFNYSPTFELLGQFLSKFEMFQKIESVYFPLTKVAEQDVSVSNFGFIGFEVDEHLNENVLKCLYYLNNLSFEEFMAFENKDIIPINRETEFDDKSLTSGTLKISIGQHKHNHYLYQVTGNRMALNWEPNTIPTFTYIDMNLHNAAITKFSKYLNYQETNIYVNSFPVVFENNDKLWETFWKQFGKIKSAKIIKPQFYSKKSTESTGKIGFVFFENFRSAVRAILLTNEKTINTSLTGTSHSVHVQTSFAIQKSNHSPSAPAQGQRSSVPNNYLAPTPHNYMKRFSWPSENYYYSPQPIVSPPLTDFNMYAPYVYYNYPYMVRDLSPHEMAGDQAVEPPSGDYPNFYGNAQPQNFNYYLPFDHGTPATFAPSSMPGSAPPPRQGKKTQKKK